MFLYDLIGGCRFREERDFWQQKHTRKTAAHPAPRLAEAAAVTQKKSQK
jgi:hypothetical protein